MITAEDAFCDRSSTHCTSGHQHCQYCDGDCGHWAESYMQFASYWIPCCSAHIQIQVNNARVKCAADLCRCHQRANSGFQIERIIYDEGWDLFGYTGWSPKLQAMVVSFRWPFRMFFMPLHVSIPGVLLFLIQQGRLLGAAL